MKLAPYGKTLQELTERPYYIFIFIGKNAWDRAKKIQSHFPATLVLPPKDSPFIYAWPVATHDIIVIDTGITDVALVKELAVCLFSYNANSVKYLSLSGERTEIKFKGSKK